MLLRVSVGVRSKCGGCTGRNRTKHTSFQNRRRRGIWDMEYGYEVWDMGTAHRPKPGSLAAERRSGGSGRCFAAVIVLVAVAVVVAVSLAEGKAEIAAVIVAAAVAVIEVGVAVVLVLAMKDMVGVTK